MVLLVRMAAAPATFRHLFAGTNVLVPKDVSRRLASLTTTGNVNRGNLLKSCRPSLPVQHGTAAKTLKYWSGVQCQTRGLFGQCRTGGLAVTKQALKTGLSNPFWVPSAGYCDYPDNIVLDSKIKLGIQPGMAVIIRGKPDPSCKQFSVSLECGRKEMQTVPFNMTAYFKERKETNNVVLNNKKKGVIDHSNEKTISTKFPFEINEDFKITVVPDKTHFQVYVNDKSFDFLPHKFEKFHKLKYVKVFGAVRVNSYQVEKH